MKRLEDLEEEYDSFQTKTNTISSLEDLYKYILKLLKDIEINVRGIKDNIEDNKIDKFFAIIKNVILFSNEEIDYYDIDNNILNEELLINLMYDNFFNTIGICSDEDNLDEMIKFIDFLVLYYSRVNDYIDGKRDNIEFSLKGYGFVDCRNEDCFEVVCEFFEKKINELSSVKEMEKVKKI